MTTYEAHSRQRSRLPLTILFFLLVGSLFAYFWQQRTVSGLRQENESLRAMTNELGRLRAENEEITRLRAENQEVERLRKDNEDLYRLRNEVGQLRKEKIAWVKDRASYEQSRVPIASQSQATTPPPTADPPTDRTPKPWLGFYYVKIPPPADADGSSTSEKIGTLVSLVRPNSPAERAGLQVNDHILKVNGRTARTVEELDAALRSLSIGQSVTFDVFRQEFPIRLEMLVEDAAANK